jgi:hypothetical protein
LEQAEVRCAWGGECEVGDVVGGEDFVFGEHAGQPPVAGGEPAGELGVVFGAGRDAGAGVFPLFWTPV